MAIYGIGATYEGHEDVSSQFIDRGLACVGWAMEDAPTLHTILSHIKTGDIIYIKSFPPNIGLIIKAAGVVTDSKVVEDEVLGCGVHVRWIWRGENRLGRLDDKYPVRGLTLYEEHNIDIQTHIINLLFPSNSR